MRRAQPARFWATIHLRDVGSSIQIYDVVDKRGIAHRKNSLSYKTGSGARVGELFMSLISTARLAHVDVFRYLAVTCPPEIGPAGMRVF
jgi:hypothetical protein